MRTGRRGTFVAILLLVSVAAGGAAHAAHDWPMAARDAARTGCAPRTLLPPYKQVWTRKLGPGPFGVRINENVQVVSVGGLAYVGTETGELHALRVADGATAWMRKLPSVISGSACVAGGVVVQGCADGVVYAFEAKSGRPAWRVDTGAGVWSAPCAAGGSVFVTSKDGCVYAIEVKTGKLRWKAETPRPIYLSPACAGGRVFVASEDMRAYAFDARTGRRLWRSKQLAGESFRDWWPVVAGDVVFFQSQPVRDSSARGKGWKRWAGQGATLEEMRRAMVESIKSERAVNQVCFALRVSDGKEAYVPPVNLNGGANHLPHPVFLTPDGHVGMRNMRIPRSDNRSRISFIDPKTGAFADKPILAGGMQVRDESGCYGSAAGWVVILSQGCWGTAWDVRTGRSIGRISGPGWHEGGAGLVCSGQYYQSPISSADGRLFLIYPSVVRAFAAARVEGN